MSNLIELIQALMPSLKSQKDLDEIYLGESADALDLERHMRLVDAATRDRARNWMFGTTMP